MKELALRVAQAGQQLNITPHRVRRLCELALIAAERTPGGHWQIPVSEIQRLLKQGVPPIPVEIAGEDEWEPEPQPSPAEDAPPERPENTSPEQPILPASAEVAQSSNQVAITKNRLAQRRIELELEGVEDGFRRREEQKAAQQAAARKLESEAQARVRRQEWVHAWVHHALEALKRIPGVPPEYESEVYAELIRTLNEVTQLPSDQVTERLVTAAIATALKPWRRQQETARVVEAARQTLPARAKNNWTPTEWDLRARQTAAAAIAELPDDAPQAQRESVAILAVRPIVQEFEHQEKCDAIACGISLPGATYDELAHGRETVLKALRTQPAGTPELAMKKTAVETLQPFQEQLRIRADQEMRSRVADCAHLMWDRSKEDAERAVAEVRQAVGKLPSFTPRPEVEQVRDQILERERAKREQQKHKGQLIERGLSEIYSYLAGLETNGYRFSEPTFSVSQRLREPIRGKLEERLKGGEDIEVVRTLVRRFVKMHLHFQ